MYQSIEKFIDDESEATLIPTRQMQLYFRKMAHLCDIYAPLRPTKAKINSKVSMTMARAPSVDA